MKRCLILFLSLMMTVSVIAMPVFAAGNGYRWHRTESEETICSGAGRLNGCRCGEGPFGVCDNRNVDSACWSDARGLGWGRRADPDVEFQRNNYVDEDGDGLCDRCGQGAGMSKEPGSQPNHGNRDGCDGTGPQGKGRGRRNR